MQEAYEKTLQHFILSTTRLYNVVKIWQCEFQCEFQKLLETDKEARAFLNTKEYAEHLCPQDAFKKRQTKTMKFFHEINERESIGYYDINSLYPYIHKFGTFPIGHPVIITHFENTQIDVFEGLIKCISPSPLIAAPSPSLSL